MASVLRPSLRRQLGVVSQEACLFSGTIGDNIAFCLPTRPHDSGASGDA
jgi:ABC-type multidrug transport system fused ATPase/permease subunit